MKRSTLCIAFAMMTFGIGTTTGCGGADRPGALPKDPPVAADLPDALPEDLSVVYAYSTGSLPPPYAYSYSYEITADGRGRFEYERGYGALRDSLLFEVDTLAVRRFYEQIKGALVRYRPPRPEDIPVGGSSSLWTVRIRGVEYTATSEANLSVLIPAEINSQIEAILRSLGEPLGDAATPAERRGVVIFSAGVYDSD